MNSYDFFPFHEAKIIEKCFESVAVIQVNSQEIVNFAKRFSTELNFSILMWYSTHKFIDNAAGLHKIIRIFLQQLLLIALYIGFSRPYQILLI